jgi:hypothetical protein
LKNKTNWFRVVVYLAVVAFWLLVMFALHGCCPKIVPLEKRVEFHDTLIVTKPAKVDTHFVLKDGEERVIYKDKLRIEVQRLRDTLRVDGECKPDTVTVQVPLYYEKEAVIKTERETPWWNWLIIGVLGLAILILALKK